MLSPLFSGEARDSPLVRPGCREMELALEGVVVMAEVEQGRGPSSRGQGFTAGSAEASLWSRLPRCGDPRFGFRSPGPGAEKDIERRAGRILGSGWATTRRPRSGIRQELINTMLIDRIIRTTFLIQICF